MKLKKDVLFLCQFFYPEYISSATLPFDTARALAESGLSVSALCGYPREYSQAKKAEKRETADGVSIQRLKYIQLKRTGAAGRLINYISFTFAVFLHFFELRHYKTVIVYSNPPMLPLIAVWAKRLFGTKLVFVAYDLYPEMAERTGAAAKGGAMSRLMNFINRRIYKYADRVVALSGEMKDFIASNRNIEACRIEVIPNWYKDTYSGTRQITAENAFYKDYAGQFVVSYLGNMGTCQDMDTVLDAARLLKEQRDICFLFAGHGNKKEKIRDIAAKEKLMNIRVMDFLHGSDYEDALKISGCAVVSLEKGLTGLCVPSKIYGNMMEGLPMIVVMEDSDIVRDVTEGNAGFAVANNDGEGMAQAILKLKNDRALQAEMSENSRRIYLEKYTTELCTAKYSRLINGLCRD